MALFRTGAISSQTYTTSQGFLLLGDKFSQGGYSGVTKTSGASIYTVTNPTVNYSLTCGNGNQSEIYTTMSIKAINTFTGASSSYTIWSGSVSGGSSVTKASSYTFSGNYNQLQATLTYVTGGSNGYTVNYLYCDHGTVNYIW